MKSILKAVAVVSAVAIIAGCACCKDGCACEECGEQAALGSKPVNKVCPIGREVIGGTPAAVATYDGETIGFCCESCVAEFAAWSDEQKAAFVTAAREGNDERLYGPK